MFHAVPSPPLPQLTTVEEVMFFDTDCGGVVHNLAYLRMIEVNRTKLAKQLGLGLKEMADSLLFAVVVKTEAHYLSPAKIGDSLRIEGKLSQIGRSRFEFHFEMFRVGDDKRLLEVDQTLALVQMPEGKPCRVPKEWRAQWSELVCA